MSSTFEIGRMGRILRYEEYLRAVVFSAVFLFAAPFFAGENRFCLRMGNGGGIRRRTDWRRKKDFFSRGKNVRLNCCAAKTHPAERES